MKKKILSILSLLLASLMIVGALATTLASCGNGNSGDKETDGSTGESSTSKPSDDSEVESGNKETEPGENGGNGGTVVVPSNDDVYGPTIDYANLIANGVQSYYTNPERDDYHIENLNMNIDFSLTGTKKLTAITNKQGVPYIKDTMDVYVIGESGKKVFASQSEKDVRTNIYRLGYYYYDVHMLDSDLKGDLIVKDTTDVSLKMFDAKNGSVGNLSSGKDLMKVQVTGGSPYVYSSYSKDRWSFKAEEYNAIQFTIKSTNAQKVSVYFIAGDNTGHTSDQKSTIQIANDGEEHTYTMLISDVPNYYGDVWRLRFDFPGAVAGDIIEVSDLKLANVEAEGVAGLHFDRTFHTYPDKLHQELHFIATKKVTGIQELGMVTEIAADTVAKLVVKDDASELHTSLDGVNWDKAEYIGFDIKDAGIFGYIMPVHENAGKMTVELVGDTYVITQTFCPKDGTIEPINAKVTYTYNDFFTGNRIYTDENHSFDAFLIEAEIERNPLSKGISSDSFVEYDALDGAYIFNISGTGFNPPFFTEWNNHYIVSAMIRSDVDRNIYVRTVTTSGCLENAAVLSDKDLVLPIPAEVSKNFGGENEEPIFNSGDKEYGETVVPFALKADTRIEFKILNLYMNWGQFPLKQLSSIQYYWPYYHLSIGTTETSCISPWYGATDLWTLPDFRAQSQPYWFELPEGEGYSNQPQHTHAGHQYFLQYTDASGNYNASENISNVIDSSGPVYVDVKMDYISDDGKIKISYNHIEFPQEDELRAYYEIEYEFLEEVTIKDFKKDFSFYSFEGYSGNYRKLGYLDVNNQPVNMDANQTDVPDFHILGDQCPYVSLYDLYSPGDSWEKNNANLGIIIHSSEFIFSGEKCTENFVISGANAVYSLSLNIGEVTLKPGDTMKINMIISPWGSAKSTDDKNVQIMRENTCLDPLTIEVANGEKIESVYTPKVMSTDGQTAEFTLSGSTSYVPVRIYGMEKLTAPKIYEKIINEEGNEEWVEYVVNSYDNMDKIGKRHYYDGYFAYRDPDGTYSYAFVVDMTDVESRTFKIDAGVDFKRWPTIPSGPLTSHNIFVGSAQLSLLAGNSFKGVSAVKPSDDGSYVRFYGDGLGTPEAYFTVFNNANKDETGRFIVMKYRVPSTNKHSTVFEYYCSTINSGATGGDAVSFGGVTADDKWHVVVIDASLRGNTFKHSDNSEEEYYALYLRLDVFNGVMDVTDYVDIAYIAFADEISQICEYEKDYTDVEEIEVRLNGTNRQYYDLFGNMLREESGEPKPEPDRVYVDPNNEQGYTLSETPYVSGIDFINGKGDGEDGSPAYDNYRSSNTGGVKVISFDGGTHDNAYLVVSGWTMVYEGIEKYVWSADGGKTWHDAVPYPSTRTFATATGGVKNMGDSQFKASVEGFNATTYNQEYYANSVYQGNENVVTGLGAHLVDYVGQEVEVTFAAVPKNDTDGLCILVHVTKVRVYASDEDAAAGEKCTHEKMVGYKFVDDGDPNTEVAKIAGTCSCGERTFDSNDPAFVFFFGSIAGTNTAPYVAENKYDYRVIDASKFIYNDKDLSFTANENGQLKISGWTGVNGGVKKIVFKVYDANGNEMTNGWTDTAATMNSRSDLNSEMDKRGIEKTYGRFYELTLPLAYFINAKNDIVTVKIALEIKGAVGGDKYLYICDINNVKVPAEPQEYVAPEVPDNIHVACVDNVTGSSVITVGGQSGKLITKDFGTVTSRGSASIRVVGWLGLDGGFSSLAYKVTCDGVDSEWININGGYSVAGSDVQGAVSGSGIDAEYAFRFDVTTSLEGYIGKTVNVTLAMVSSVNGKYVSFFEAKNVKVICDHKSLGDGYTFVGDEDPYTDEAKIAAKCVCGEKGVDPKTPQYVFYFEKVTGSVGVSSVATCENKNGYIVVDCAAKGITLSQSGIIEVDGWGGVNGGSSKIVYKVYDANGNELTYEWTEFDVETVTSATAELQGETSGRGIEVEYGTRYMDMKVNLAQYLEGRDSITVKFAMVCDGAPEGSNDAYVYLCEFKNLKAAQ